MANKLELTWVGKDTHIDIEPRILIEKPELGYSYSQAKKHGQVSVDEVANADGIYDNMLIHGDNLLALKALEQEYAGKVKCIYIDPPYNTGSAFSAYEDNLEHSIWLSLMKPRLELLRNLLSKEGIICIQIDHAPNAKTGQSPEMAYLQILVDEVFGRVNYITNLIWKKKGNASNTATTIGTITESILLYAKNKKMAIINKEEFEKEYKNEDENGKYNLELFLKTDSGTYKRDTMKFEIVDFSTGDKYLPPKGQRWTFGKDSIDEYNKRGLLVFKEGKVYFKRYKIYESSKLFNNLLLEHGSLKSAKKEIEALGFDRESFDTPKPEILIQAIINMVSNPGDLVLDSFLGSGTTAAVAHKMGRRWIGIEMGEHAYTHCKVRLDKVVSGEDQGGISKTQNWKGGGGYKFYELAPSLILKDKYDREIINPVYNADMLAAAMAKQEGCVYCPSAECYWKQAKSTENAYLYTTTQHLTREYLDEIADDLKEFEHLIIACKSFESSLEHAYKNITIKKIPNILLDRCEFGKSDYKLNVVDMPIMDEDEDDE